MMRRKSWSEDEKHAQREAARDATEPGPEGRREPSAQAGDYESTTRDHAADLDRDPMETDEWIPLNPGSSETCSGRSG